MAKLTPMMAQYNEIKNNHEDCILMFRLGDFYEMFFEDAKEASKILQITLTARGKGSAEKIPMCGIPFHAVDNYLSKLTKVGKKVALCEQVTKPDGQGIVEREVVRIVTPGTTFDENILEQKSNNFVAAIVFEKENFSIAYSDLTTGEFKVTEVSGTKNLISEITKVNPAELICSEEIMPKIKEILINFENLHIFPYNFYEESEKLLKDHFKLSSLQSFGIEGHKLATLSSAMLFSYLKETQKTDLKHIQKISFYEVSDFMPLDGSCIRNLELFYTNMENKKEGSLINVLDETVTSMGGRMLRKWLLNPLLDKKKIESRLNRIDILLNNSMLLRELRDKLSNIYDIERLLSRLSLGSGNARDLIALKESLKIVPELKILIKEQLPKISENLLPLNALTNLIDKAILEEAANSLRDGGMIKDGYNSELDDLRSISSEGKTFIKNLQEREIKRTKINSLKVRFNKVFGYYIEVSKTNLNLVPDYYVRKQTLVNAERFITPELKEYEEKVLTAEDKIKELEYELFYQVRMEVIKEIVKIQNIAKAIAALDVLSNLAFIANKNNYCKPEIIENGEIEIKNGRHPVIEKIRNDFIPNDCKFDNDQNFVLLTGPNMGGKSTYLRQIALIVLLAQIGSFVPAEAAKISLVDRIFTRVGAADNLSKGESTFMVEMNEASFILNHATEKSLIILDEIGRGTSTYDGVSIAWAIMEFIHDKIKAKTIFATHYHELVALADKLSKASNMSVAVRENEIEGVVFLYKIVDGGVDKSYGIEVAKLAGLPNDIISRSRGVLAELEKKNIKSSNISPNQLGIFKEPRKHSGLEKEIKNLDINTLTPLQALEKLNKIKREMGN